MPSDIHTSPAERLTVSDVDVATFRFWRPITGYIHDSILAKGAEHVVVADVQFLDPVNRDLFHFDMTGNWWGSDNPDSIQAWISESVDDTTFSTVIDWEPYKDQPVGVKTQSLGGIKSMFR